MCKLLAAAALAAARVAAGGAAAGAAKNAKEEEMDKEDGVTYFVEYLYSQIVGNKDSVAAGKILAYLQCHRKPGQSFPEYHNAHEDCVNELEGALKADHIDKLFRDVDITLLKGCLVQHPTATGRCLG